MSNEWNIEQVFAALRLSRVALADAASQVPNAPGIYAVYAGRETWEKLGLGTSNDERPLYVGKSESSLRQRDLKTHFLDGRTGQSTLRRSFAALLKCALSLSGMPRNPRNPGHFSNFGLSSEDDAKLTAWMLDKLQLGWWTGTSGAELRDVEAAVIAELEPPLNLTHCRTAWSATIKSARAKLAAEARRWQPSA